MPDMQSMLLIFIAFVFFFVFVGGGGIFAIIMWRTYRRLSNMNCLYWTHADNTADGNDSIDLIHIETLKEFTVNYFAEKGWPLGESYYRKNKEKLTAIDLIERKREAGEAYKKQNKYPAGAPVHPYKEAFWQFWKVNVCWVYEKKHVEDNGEITYSIDIFNPDEHIDFTITTSELAENVDWTDSKPVYKIKQALLEKAAYAAPVLIGLASIGCIFMLSIFLLG